MSSKSISRFLPVTTHPPEESERHYVEVHFPWAQEMLRQHPQVRTYHINRVLRQYDLRGHWRQRPTAWRFVLLTFDPGTGLDLDPATAGLIAADHPNCLRGLRSCPVEERVMIDRRSGQTAMEKYLIEFDRDPTVDAGTADERFEAILGELLEHLDGAFGLRLVRSNRVLGEAETEPVIEDGQRSTGRMRPSTDKHAYVEVHVDDILWGDRVFAQPEVRDLLRDEAFSVLEAYHVEERCGLDRDAGRG